MSLSKSAALAVAARAEALPILADDPGFPGLCLFNALSLGERGSLGAGRRWKLWLRARGPASIVAAGEEAQGGDGAGDEQGAQHRVKRGVETFNFTSFKYDNCSACTAVGAARLKGQQPQQQRLLHAAEEDAKKGTRVKSSKKK